MEPDTLPYYMARSLLIIVVSVYLYLNGYRLLGALSAVYNLAALLLFVIAWIMCRISLPLGDLGTSRRWSKPQSTILAVVVWGVWVAKT